jgi:predicted RNA-binding protein YlxR (DUF448 family)/ribosomal protein L30E
MAKEIPLRTCIGCRETLVKTDLMRFVLSPDDSLVPDLYNKLPGRGAYTCPNISCVRKAGERKQFSRAFKRDLPAIDAEDLILRIVQAFEDKIASYIALANKAGKVISGSDMVVEVLRKNSSTKKIVLISTDISEDIGQRIRGLAELHNVQFETLFNKARFGDLLGKGLRSVIIVQGEGFVGTLIKEIERYRNFLRGEGCADE